MEVTVAVRPSKSRLTGRGQRPVDLKKLIATAGDYKVLRVYGRGRFATVKISQRELIELRDVLGDKCVFTKIANAEPFERKVIG